MVPNVLLAVKNENTVVVGNMNHASIPVRHLQIPH